MVHSLFLLSISFSAKTTTAFAAATLLDSEHTLTHVHKNAARLQYVLRAARRVTSQALNLLDEAGGLDASLPV